MTKRHPFNLIEILLALGVIMFGLVCLLGLFPLAAKVTSDATMETYATSAAEELMAFITEQATTAEGSTTADARSPWEEWISGSDSRIPDTQPSGMLGSDEAAHQEEIQDANKWETVSDRQRRIFRHKTEKGVFMLVSMRGDKGTEQDIVLTDEKDLAKIDSRVLITVWKEPITRIYKAPPTPENTYTDSDYQFGVRLNMKVGWPAERPEAGKDEGGTLRPLRTVHLYSFDLLRPAE